MIWKLTWFISEEQLSAIREFYRTHRNSPMVKRRRKKNVAHEGLDFSKDTFLKAMLCCLATSQNRSGPESKVAHFLRTRPFPITIRYCRANRKSLAGRLQRQLSKAGIRFSGRIAGYFTENLDRLEDSRWQLLKEMRDGATDGKAGAGWERVLAQRISSASGDRTFKLAGFGLKQARNLLQIMGVTRYEVPLDSRVLKWLDRYGFPYPLSDNQLQLPALYDILVDSIQEISRQIGVYPCVLDAAIFAAVDGGGWTDDNLIF
jgi:thermostable 8-oxoguanine DNA glycosylase